MRSSWLLMFSYLPRSLGHPSTLVRLGLPDGNQSWPGSLLLEGCFGKSSRSRAEDELSSILTARLGASILPWWDL